MKSETFHGEIVNDELAESIYKIVSEEEIHTILEIGAGNGVGSTNVFVRAIKDSNKQEVCVLYSLELLQDRFDELVNNHIENKFIKFYNYSSILKSEYPSVAEVTEFYNSTHTNLNQHPLELVLSWREFELKYLDLFPKEDGINLIKKDHDIDNFDLVLIDGSAFTGLIECKKVLGATYIILDDINDIKNLDSYKFLESNNYKLLKENWTVRNGYAIFKKI